MHAVKSRAKQQAWRREDAGKYNPWAKFNRKPSVPLSRTTTRDLEQGRSGPRQPNVDSIGEDNISGGLADGGSPVRNSEPAASDTHLTLRQRLGNKLHKDSGSDSASQGPKTKHKITAWSQFKAIVFGSWINLLLVCVPLGIALNYAKVNQKAVFVINFMAIVPLAGILSYSTEEISMRVGETLGGLLNASFGNAVELIVSIIALAEDQILIVQTSLIGSMLSNLLLVMGMCFFFGGLNRPHQNFNVTVAQTAASLLTLAISSLIIPTVFVQLSSATGDKLSKVPALSRGVAIILLFIYGCYLLFQLKTHAEVYQQKSQKVAKREHKPGDPNMVKRGLQRLGMHNGAHAAESKEADVLPQQENGSEENEEGEEEEQPQLTAIGAIVSLCISTAFVGLCAEYMVSSIGAITTDGGVSPEFVGLILIPIVGNAAEHATAVTVAIKDKMDLAIGVAVGSSMQIALLVLPLVVVIGWIMGRDDMTLNVDGFLIALLFITVLLVNYLIADGKSHWLEGVLLMATYVIIAVAAYLYPQNENVVG